LRTRDFASIEQQLASIRRMEAHHAFDERRLAGAILAEQRMK